MDDNAAEIVVHQYPAVLFAAAFVPQVFKHVPSDLRCEILPLRHNGQQALSILALWIETLGDVNVERGDVLLALQAQAPH